MPTAMEEYYWQSYVSSPPEQPNVRITEYPCPPCELPSAHSISTSTSSTARIFPYLLEVLRMSDPGRDGGPAAGPAASSAVPASTVLARDLGEASERERFRGERESELSALSPAAR